MPIATLLRARRATRTGFACGRLGIKGGTEKALAKALILRGFATSAPATDQLGFDLSGIDGRDLMLRITDAGLRAIDIEPQEAHAEAMKWYGGFAKQFINPKRAARPGALFSEHAACSESSPTGRRSMALCRHRNRPTMEATMTKAQKMSKRINEHRRRWWTRLVCHGVANHGGWRGVSRGRKPLHLGGPAPPPSLRPAGLHRRLAPQLRRRLPFPLGRGLNHARQVMAATRQTAARKLRAVLSYRVAIPRKSLMRQKARSMTLRSL